MDLEFVRPDLVRAFKRTFESETSPERIPYQPEGYLQYVAPLGVLERRLLRIFTLDQVWYPEPEWLVEALSVCAARWRAGRGGRVATYELLRRVPNSILGTEAGREALEAAEQWLSTDLSETAHWTAYLEFLDQVRGTPYPDDLAEAFEDHAYEELSRWHPSPPDMDELISHASGFDLWALGESLSEKAAEEESGGHGEPVRATSGGWFSEQDSTDEAIEGIFARFGAQPECDQG